MAGGLGGGWGIKGRGSGWVGSSEHLSPTQPTNQPTKSAMDSFTLFSNNVSATTSVPAEEETGGGRGTGAYCTIA
ncbi:fungal mating-type domain-containing protein-containing protein [Coprinopsis cinerea okayama7|uniref:Fungal mating-type domain-containing protein-containing protein n=1 Tax=Coprinopsis cinerea (strain Okayama-7 / 130 / ATCC MYA-4618 / FGSC 9003) TaxID=240176 RepID=D6RM51_COPC7|nr:fungal mating-type domain-containing protein-containing protein [Coprinopsis cinerea okayama7\|eukprot:XP_002911512.1 fungal mating-type domain-containing protein-containing protein [Coprinopsis cinerea okayama7\